jgi:hypothetical protein
MLISGDIADGVPVQENHHFGDVDGLDHRRHPARVDRVDTNASRATASHMPPLF